MNEIWEEWSRNINFLEKTRTADMARPYKLGGRYGFVLLPAHQKTFPTYTIGKIVDASELEIVVECAKTPPLEKPEFFLVVIGRSSVISAIEV